MKRCGIIAGTCPELGRIPCDGCELFKIYHKYKRDSEFITVNEKEARRNRNGKSIRRDNGDGNV